jgi:hypothetical protein
MKDITNTQEYEAAQEFVKLSDSDEIAYRYAEMLIKLNEMDLELGTIKVQLHATIQDLRDTIEYIHDIIGEHRDGNDRGINS